MFRFLRTLFKKKKTVFADLSGMAMTDEAYNRIKREQEACAMALLDKINRKGRESLTEEEQAFLQAYSKSGYANES